MNSFRTPLFAFSLVLALASASHLHAGLVIDGTLEDTNPLTRVDQIAFTVATGGPTTIDVLSFEFDDLLMLPVDVNGDGEFAFFDPIIYLFSDLSPAGLIAVSDDNLDFLFPPFPGAADGSVSLVDPFLEVPLTAGNYILSIGATPPPITLDEAIAGADPFPGKMLTIDPQTDLPTPFHDHGDYRITFSDNVSSAAIIPEPASLLLWAALFGISAAVSSFRLRRALK
jgi:hypothetical protein